MCHTSKIGKIVCFCYLNNEKGSLHYYEALQKMKEYATLVADFKKVFSSSSDIRVTFKIFWGPAISLKATLKHEILELLSLNNLAQHGTCQTIFFKKSEFLENGIMPYLLVTLSLKKE